LYGDLQTVADGRHATAICLISTLVVGTMASLWMP
jgi:hypothetical protein